jgi:fermentation-respiration switch protein FrsA (DUF1100 family)
LRRAAVLLGGSLLASAWVIVPLVEQRRWAAVNEAFHGTLLVNGYGARRVFYWLVSGQLLDHGRLPVVTVFAALGLGLAWLAWSSDADGRALLVALAVCLLLAFGRTTFGSLADLVPGSADLFFRRFMMGAQLAALLLAGRGAAWLTAGGGRLLNARVPRWPPGLSRAVVLVAAVAVLAPAWLQLGAYDHRDGAAIAAQRQADDTQGAALDRLIAVIDRDGGGRTYAGMPSNWGQGFTVGTVPVFKYLESRDIDEVGYTLRTASLMTEPEYYFDARDPSDYRLFGIRYLILPARHQPPVRARLAMRSGPYWLWTIEGAGYVQAGRIVGEIAANRTNVGARSVALLRSGLAADGAYLSVRYGVDDGGNGRRPTVRSQASAGAVRAERADLDDGEAAATVRMRRPGVAVLSASYDPGWTAIVNGRRRTTRMVAPALVAVDVPAGTDHVVFRFRGYDDYPELLVLSGLTLAIIAIAPACVRRARRRRADLDQDGVLWRLRGPRVSLKPAAGSDSVAGARTASASLARTHMRSSGDHIGGGFVTRSDVTFSSGGVDCAAWLFRPDREGPCPLVVMAHGFSATRELRLDAYAERFCDSGLGVLVFDYRHFGASAGQPRQLLGIRMQQDDYRAAVSYARALEWVDSARVALFGTSFSGGHVLAVAARDQRIAAVVSQCPFTDGLASLPKLGPANIAKATVAGLRDQLADLVGRAPQYIPAVGPPGSFAVMTTPDSQPGFEALLPPESRWENRVAARIALRVASYRPGRSAAKVACPVLFCVCDGDTVAPAKTTLKYARAAPRGEIKHYPVGHFDIYLGETWERAVADQTEFFSRCLAGSRESAEIDDTVARS